VACHKCQLQSFIGLYLDRWTCSDQMCQFVDEMKSQLLLEYPLSRPVSNLLTPLLLIMIRELTFVLRMYLFILVSIHVTGHETAFHFSLSVSFRFLQSQLTKYPTLGLSMKLLAKVIEPLFTVILFLIIAQRKDLESRAAELRTEVAMLEQKLQYSNL
jgi:hypothetical protein